MVININADNFELEESDSGSKVVNINEIVEEEEEFIPDYEDYEDYDDDDIGVVSLRLVKDFQKMIVCFSHLLFPAPRRS